MSDKRSLTGDFLPVERLTDEARVGQYSIPCDECGGVTIVDALGILDSDCECGDDERPTLLARVKAGFKKAFAHTGPLGDEGTDWYGDDDEGEEG